eukprot:COSAG01_NODE_1413_length_10398_cov_73.448296_10_plen_48_part_01
MVAKQVGSRSRARQVVTAACECCQHCFHCRHTAVASVTIQAARRLQLL